MSMQLQGPFSIGPQYFRSFASYEIPFRPDEPVTYAETEGLKSFYAAYRDGTDRLARFDKLRLVRCEKESREAVLPHALPTDSEVYFAVMHEPTTGAIAVGDSVSYGETEFLPEFFAGSVGPTGLTCRLTRLRKEIVFSDAYEYWPNGRLRKRTTVRPTGPASVSHYNGEGALLAENVIPEPTSQSQAR